MTLTRHIRVCVSVVAGAGGWIALCPVQDCGFRHVAASRDAALDAAHRHEAAFGVWP